jgi:SAM-dependent methyltransferase
MLAQRGGRSAPAIRAVAERLPVRDDAFDAALAVLTIHHWTDPFAGLRELQRVASRQVVLHFEPGFPFWFADEYLPKVRPLEIWEQPPVSEVVAALSNARVEPVLVPHDCVDGFFASYWRRPAAYLDPSVRANISYLARLGDDALRPGLDRLRRDLASGAWEETHQDLLACADLDAGYRLIVAG